MAKVKNLFTVAQRKEIKKANNRLSRLYKKDLFNTEFLQKKEHEISLLRQQKVADRFFLPYSTATLSDTATAKDVLKQARLINKGVSYTTAGAIKQRARGAKTLSKILNIQIKDVDEWIYREAFKTSLYDKLTELLGSREAIIFISTISEQQVDYLENNATLVNVLLMKKEKDVYIRDYIYKDLIKDTQKIKSGDFSEWQDKI